MAKKKHKKVDKSKLKEAMLNALSQHGDQLSHPEPGATDLGAFGNTGGGQAPSGIPPEAMMEQQ